MNNINNDIVLKIPKKDTIVVHVQKPKKKRVKDNLTFRSYRIIQENSYIYIGNKRISSYHLLTILRKHKISTEIPISINTRKIPPTESIDWNPQAYNGPTSWSFYWNNIKCSITGSCNHYNSIWIRVHDLTPGVGQKIINNILKELLAYYIDPTKAPPSMLQLYTVKQGIHGHVWVKHSSRLHRSMNTIYIDPNIKNKLIDQLTKFCASSEMYDKYGVTWKRVHLFHGPPGTGKTSTILALASKFKKNLAKMTITPQLNSQDIETLFQTIPSGTWVILEDVDALFVEREAKGSVDFSTLLNCMDGITTQRGLVLFMTTNNPTKLEQAFLRPGRVDISIAFELPNRKHRLQALESLASEFSNEHDIFLDNNPTINIAEMQKYLFDCIMEEKKSIL